jgi:bifunctional non-homologous end joining protein LigD
MLHRQAFVAPIGAPMDSPFLAAPVVSVKGLRPMEAHHELCTFKPGEWRFERMYSGLRVIAQFGSGGVEMRTRSGSDCTNWFPEVAAGLAAVRGGPFIVDGVVADPTRSDAGSKRRVEARTRHRAPHPKSRPLVYCVFDLLVEFGFDLTRFPLGQRQLQLGFVLPQDQPALLLVPALEPGKGSLRSMMEAHRLARTVAKRLDSEYESGRRSKAWVIVEGASAFAGRVPNTHAARRDGPAPEGDERRPGRRTVIELDDRFAVRDWAIVLNTTAEQLVEAVRIVGNRVDDVATYLRSHG